MTHMNALTKASNAMHTISILDVIRRLALALVLALPLTVSAAEQKTFATPDEAVDALLTALKADDDAAMLAIFGDQHKDLVVSPDRAANSATRAKAAAAMQTYKKLEDVGNDRRILLIGDRVWELTYAVPEGIDPSGADGAFFGSFRITKSS